MSQQNHESKRSIPKTSDNWIKEAHPDLKAFIYQQISELELYLTPDCTVTVVAKDPLKLLAQIEEEGRDITRSELKRLYRIVITIKENDSQLEAEGLHENTFEAIRIAKTVLMRKLIEIQDKVISAQDRMSQINSYLNAGNLH